jgi:hypothetical protein
MKKVLQILLAALGFASVNAASAASSHFDDAMNGILSHYLKIHQRLTADSLDGISLEAEAIYQATSQATFKPPADLKDSVKNLAALAKLLSGAPDLDAAREQFKALSQALTTWVLKSKPAGLQVMYCADVDATWIQPKGGTNNPYTGRSHAPCGEPVQSSQK